MLSFLFFRKARILTLEKFILVKLGKVLADHTECFLVAWISIFLGDGELAVASGTTVF